MELSIINKYFVKFTLIFSLLFVMFILYNNVPACANNRENYRQLKIKKRRPFSVEEDATLTKLVERYGSKNNWNLISKLMTTRTNRQCQERWNNFLAPEIKKSSWTNEEDNILKEKYLEIGPKWSKISLLLPGRKAIDIKNRFNCHIKKIIKKEENNNKKENNDFSLFLDISEISYINFNEYDEFMDIDKLKNYDYTDFI